jgi:hypothetical protein
MRKRRGRGQDNRMSRMDRRREKRGERVKRGRWRELPSNSFPVNPVHPVILSDSAFLGGVSMERGIDKR